MKMFNYFLAFFAISVLALTSCKDEPDPILAPVISSIQAVGTSFSNGSVVTKDLNGAASAADVALNSVITATLDKAIDGTTVNVSNASISDGTNDVAASVTSNGSSITITPSEDLARGTSHTLTLSGVKSSDGGSLATVTRTFVTEGKAPVVVPKADDQIAYWNFDSQADDQVGAFNPDNIVKIEYGTDRFGQGGSTATFDGDESIIEIPGADALMASDDIAFSFWMKTNTNGHTNADGNLTGMFVYGLAAFQGFEFEIFDDYQACVHKMAYEKADASLATSDLWFPGNGEDNSNGGFAGFDFTADLTGSGGVASLILDKWVHVVISYSAQERQGRMYFNGELMKSQDFDLFPEANAFHMANGVAYNGNPDQFEPILALGFIKSIDSPEWAGTPWGDYNVPTSKHFKGDLDDFRIWKAALTEAEVKSLYDSEK